MECIFFSVILTLCLFLNKISIAQPITEQEPFNQITNESGRSLGFITGIVQDSTGFLWIASRNGLFKYDGYSFTSYRKSPQKPNGLPFSDLTFLYYDRSKHLWMRHFDRLYAFKNEKISNLFDTILSSRFSHNTQIVQDASGNYWFGPHENKIYRFHPKTPKTDTIIGYPNIWPEELIKKIIPKNPSVKIELSPSMPNIDTAVSFSLSQPKSFLVISAGEGNRFKLFDFGSILSNKEKIWSPDYSKSIIDKSSPLFYVSIDVVTLKPGNYKICYNNDNANTFNPSEVDPKLLKCYGIYLIEISNPEQIKKHLLNPQLKPNELYGNNIYQLALNKKGYPILSTNKAILEYDPKTDCFQIKKIVNLNDEISNQITIPIIQTKDNQTIVAEYNNIYVQRDNDWELFPLGNSDQVLSLLFDSDQYLWVGTTNGIYILDIKQKPVRRLIHITSTNANRLYSNKIWQLYEDRSKNIWIGTDKGLNQFTKSKFWVINLENERYSPQPMIIDKKHTVYLLAKNGDWLEIGNNSINRKRLTHKHFDYIKATNEYIFDFNDLYFDEKTQKVFFTTGNKIGKMTLNGKFDKVISLPKLKNETENIAVKLLPLHEEIAVATIDKILFLNKNLSITGEIPYPQTIENGYDVSKKFIKDFVAISNDTLALRTEYAVYIVKASQPQILIQYEIPEILWGTDACNGNLTLDDRKNLWFAVLPDIIFFNGNQFQTKTLPLNEDLGNGKIVFHQQTLNIGSSAGLFVFNDIEKLLAFTTQTNDTISQDLFRHYSTLDGLIDNNITQIFITSLNKPWVATLKGLCNIDPENNQVQTWFRDGDYLSLGFPGSMLTYQENQSPRIVLQTTNGLLTFKPDSVNPYPPQVVITEISLFGKPLETDSLPWEKRFLKLKYNQNFLTFTFSALDFTQPNLNRYRYKMVNFNNEWTYTDANNRRAPFTGIPPGKYTFVVEGTNNDGVWTTAAASLMLVITPPWYKTTLAYILYVVFTIVGIVAFIKIRERKLIEEKRILEEMVRARTAEIMKQKEEIQHQRDKIAEQNKNIKDSINYASRIQSALLPSQDVLKKYLRSYFVLWRPRDIVSGDFFWMTHHNDITIIVAADCTGHGVPGAFMSMLGIAFLNDIVNKEKIFETNQILQELRNNIMTSLKQTGEEGGSKDGMDISICAINYKTLKAKFSGAYNPLLIVRDNECLEYKADKMPIGYHIKKDEKFTQHDINLQIGDRLYMLSDGYVDQFGGEDGRKFMSKRFKQILVDSRHLEMQEQKEFLNRTIEEWMGTREQIDDILVFGIEITGNHDKTEHSVSYYPQMNVNEI